MSNKYFVHIVAVDENNGIGFEDKLLFRISEDLKQFKRLTLGNVVIAGTKTIKTLPKLVNRHVVCLTRKEIPFTINDKSDLTLVNDINVIKTSGWSVGGNKAEPLFIIGGGEVYKETLKDVSVIILTRIHAKAKNVDTYYPDFLTLRKPTYCTESTRQVDSKTGLEYSFLIYGYDKNHLKHFLNFKHRRDKDEKYKTTETTLASKN